LKSPRRNDLNKQTARNLASTIKKNIRAWL
jgi:hypothetical protein